jgi:hypothetical protein
MKHLLGSVITLLFLNPAHADDAVRITDASQLNWTIDSSGKVWLRNLNQFDSTFLGCCYNFYIDTTTQYGMLIWGSVQVAAVTSSPLTLYVSSKATAGNVTIVVKE